MAEAAQPAPPSLPYSPSAHPARELRLQVGGPGRQAGVQVRLETASGKVSVTVRTPDAGLRDTLRSGLSELAARFDEQGLAARIWRPSTLEAGPHPGERPPLEKAVDLPADPGNGDGPPAGRDPSGGGQHSQGQRRHPSYAWTEIWSEEEPSNPSGRFSR